MDGTETKFVGVKTKKKALSLRTAFNEDGNATNFLYFGTDRNTKVELAKMDEFTGIIYAPKAEVKLKAGSVKYYRCHLNGSIQGFKVKLRRTPTSTTTRTSARWNRQLRGRVLKEI
jgi:hypothetical protein